MPSDQPVGPPDHDAKLEAELAAETCAECGRVLAPQAGVRLGSGQRFCSTCYADLRSHLESIADEERQEISYPGALLGAILGGAAGAVLWWQVTVLTHVSFGLIAVAIAYLVAWGIRFTTGGKRSPGLQAMAVATSLVSFMAGLYLVNRSLILGVMRSGDGGTRLPWMGSPSYVWQVLTARMNADPAAFLDLLFAAITVYQAWALTRPLRIPRQTR